MTKQMEGIHRSQRRNCLRRVLCGISKKRKFDLSKRKRHIASRERSRRLNYNSGGRRGTEEDTLLTKRTTVAGVCVSQSTDPFPRFTPGWPFVFGWRFFSKFCGRFISPLPTFISENLVEKMALKWFTGLFWILLYNDWTRLVVPDDSDRFFASWEIDYMIYCMRFIARLLSSLFYYPLRLLYSEDFCSWFSS